MKNKISKIILIIIIVLLICLGIYNNEDNKFVQDNVLFAVTLDGKGIDYFPERGEYDVSITCKNGIGKWLTKDWKFVIENITGKVSCNLDFTTSPDILNELVQKEAQSNEKGYRYTGINPDNYIWFNNEMWRIIGSIPVKNENGTTENLVKIIRNNSIGNLTYDAKSSSYTGAWGKNTLYSLLNGYYYGKKNGTDSDYCYASHANNLKGKCDYSVIGLSSQDFYGSMVENVYWNTGIAEVHNSVDDAYNGEIAVQTVQGYVGLMSASDYGYATDSNDYAGRVGEGIASTIWLYGKNNEWTSIQSSESYALYIYNSGDISNGIANAGLSVRPVVYLDPSVYVVSGNGTEANPYQIAM